jgi:hypothetical protein
MLDLILNIASLALVPFILAAMGGHLATIALEDSKQRFRWKAGFWALAILGIAIVCIQSVRASREQHDLQGNLGKIETNTEKVGSLQFIATVPVDGDQPITAGRSILLNNWFENRSAASVSDVRTLAIINFGENSMAGEINSELNFLNQLHAVLQNDKGWRRFDMAPGDPQVAVTSVSPLLTSEDIKSLRRLKEAVYLHLYLEWTDKGKLGQKEECWYLVTPPTMDIKPPNTLLHTCNRLPATMQKATMQQ